GREGDEERKRDRRGSLREGGWCCGAGHESHRKSSEAESESAEESGGTARQSDEEGGGESGRQDQRRSARHGQRRAQSRLEKVEESGQGDLTRFADLHLHTYHSDGTRSPHEVVDLARDRGLDIIAISHHDHI